GSYGFVIPSPGGGPLVDAEVSPDDLNEARTRWRDLVRGTALGVVVLTLLLCAGRLLDLRRGAKDVRSYTVHTLAALVTVGLTYLIVGFATSAMLSNSTLKSSLDVFAISLMSLAAV